MEKPEEDPKRHRVPKVPGADVQSADPMSRHLQCPNCGKKLTNRSCKWWCACGYHESCADG